MKALLIVLAVLLGLWLLPVLLLAIPVRIYAAFDGGLTVSLRLFGIRFRVFDFTAEPKKKPAKKQKQPPKRNAGRLSAAGQARRAELSPSGGGGRRIYPLCPPPARRDRSYARQDRPRRIGAQAGFTCGGCGGGVR